MRNPAVLYPMFALAAWTLIVLLLIPIARVRSARRREIVVDDFKYGESAAVPPAVSIPNRNFMNLLELPMRSTGEPAFASPLDSSDAGARHAGAERGRRRTS